MVVGAHSARHPQDMAGQKLFGAAEVSVRGVCVAITGGEEDFGGWDEEDLGSL